MGTYGECIVPTYAIHCPIGQQHRPKYTQMSILDKLGRRSADIPPHKGSPGPGGEPPGLVDGDQWARVAVCVDCGSHLAWRYTSIGPTRCLDCDPPADVDRVRTWGVVAAGPDDAHTLFAADWLCWGHLERPYYGLLAWAETNGGGQSVCWISWLDHGSDGGSWSARISQRLDIDPGLVPPRGMLADEWATGLLVPLQEPTP